MSFLKVFIESVDKYALKLYYITIEKESRGKLGLLSRMNIIQAVQQIMLNR